MGEAAHGKDLVVTVDAIDISAAVKTSTLELNPDIHDITGYGSKSKRKRGGLIDGTFTVSGWFDVEEMAGPSWLSRRPGERVPITRQLLGTGTGLPKDTFDAIIGKYTETAPVDDIVTWSCDFAIDGDVTTADQAADSPAVLARGE